MKNSAWILVLCLGFVISGSQLARAQEKVIDNFISHGATYAVLVNGERDLRRSGDPANIAGGFRLIRFGVAPLPGGPARATALELSAQGPLFVESGVNSTVGVQLSYGTGPGGSANPLNLDLPGLGLDRFRIEFGACDLALNYLVQVFDGNGNNAIHSGPVSTANQNLPFTADFIFTNFLPGGPNPVNWQDIDLIVIQFNTGNATGGQDFSIKRIVALPPQ